MISDKRNASPGIADCSLYTRLIAIKDVYHKERLDMIAYTPVEFNYKETLAKAFIIPPGQKQFIHENIFNNVPVPRFANAINTNYAFLGE